MVKSLVTAWHSHESISRLLRQALPHDKECVTKGLSSAILELGTLGHILITAPTGRSTPRNRKKRPSESTFSLTAGTLFILSLGSSINGFLFVVLYHWEQEGNSRNEDGTLSLEELFSVE